MATIIDDKISPGSNSYLTPEEVEVVRERRFNALYEGDIEREDFSFRMSYLQNRFGYLLNEGEDNMIGEVVEERGYEEGLYLYEQFVMEHLGRADN